MFDETHAMQISEYLCFTYQIVGFFFGSKKKQQPEKPKRHSNHWRSTLG